MLNMNLVALGDFTLRCLIRYGNRALKNMDEIELNQNTINMDQYVEFVRNSIDNITCIDVSQTVFEIFL